MSLSLPEPSAHDPIVPKRRPLKPNIPKTNILEHDIRTPPPQSRVLKNVNVVLNHHDSRTRTLTSNVGSFCEMCRKRRHQCEVTVMAESTRSTEAESQSGFTSGEPG
ncbi:Hypothetical predicted protein [Xyrichtys novacula]|uniref:Uncharacterized protein n=1 Tax=Xyrichtys novacula TaxID=13765 RepID=A0AAV1HGH5_XYRNO|nr:Hypothetical predicted protein [Xyrichtys novacula]